MTELTQENWQEYFKVQPTGYLFYAMTKNTEDGMSFVVEKTTTPVEHEYNQEQLVKALKETIASFPKRICYDEFTLDQAANKVALHSRRGKANVRLDKSFWYQGTHWTDSPIFVSESNGLYAVTKHPQFQNYGFVVEDEADDNT